jgi:hypothetical protein
MAQFGWASGVMPGSAPTHITANALGGPMTKEQTKEYIAALLRERAGYVQYDKPDQVELVDAELERLGHKAKTPAQRAAKMAPKARTEL